MVLNQTESSDDDISMTSDESTGEGFEVLNENKNIPTREEKIKQNLREAMGTADQHFSD